MAQRRMISLSVVDTDDFLDMKLSAQALYFHLVIRADDDGFVSSPKKVLRVTGCSEDDLQSLISEDYLIPFDCGVVAVRDWLTQNKIKGDRHHPTIYSEEKSRLAVDGAGRYTLREQTASVSESNCTNPASSLEPTWNHVGTDLEPEVRLGKVRSGKVRVDEAADKPRASRFQPPCLEDVIAYCVERGNKIDAQRFFDYYTANGWKVGRNPMRDWKAAVRSWESRKADDKDKNAVPTAEEYREGWT